MMTYLLYFVLVFFLAFLILELKLYQETLVIVILGVLVLAPRALRIPPFVLLTNVGVFEILFVAVVLAWIIGGKYRYFCFSSIPINRLLLVFLLCLLVANCRLYLSTENIAVKITDLRIQAFILAFPLILSASDYPRMLKRVYFVMVTALVVISTVTLFVYSTGIMLPGLKLDTYNVHGRVLWGGMFLWFPFLLLLILTTLRFFTREIKVFLYMALAVGFAALLVSQTRHLLILLAITVLVYGLRTGLISVIRKHISLVFLVILFIFAVGTLYHDTRLSQVFKDYGGRFSQVQRDVPLNVLSEGSVGSWRLGRWRSFAYTIEKTRSAVSLFFGHGSGFQDFNDKSYLHSGWGWIYASMGLIGVLVWLLLVIKTYVIYSSYAKKNRRNDLNTILIDLSLSFLLALCVIGIFNGVFIQSFNLFFNALLIGILEVCRRNIIRGNNIYHIL